MNEKKVYDLATVLTMTSGIALIDLDKLHEELSSIFGLQLAVNDIYHALMLVKPYILNEFPQLAGVGEQFEDCTQEQITEMLKPLSVVLGSEFEIETIFSPMYKKQVLTK